MKRKISITVIISLLFVFNGIVSATMINDTYIKSNQFDNSDNEIEWTILFYFDADNDLEYYALEDFIEIADIGSTDQVKFVMQLDRVYGYDYDYGDWTTTKRFLIEKDMRPKSESAIQDIGEANMGDPQTLIDFVNWGKSAFPANNYCLILWDHGTGWKDDIRKNVCYDSTDQDALEIFEFYQIFSAISNNGENKLSLVGFDACLMGMTEIAYELKDFADYMTASEETEPADGWNYKESLSYLVSSPEEITAEDLGELFVSYYSGYEITLSTVDLSTLDDLKDIISDFADILKFQDYRNDIYHAIQNVETFSDLDYIDIYHFAEIIQSRIYNQEVDEKAQNVMDQISISVVSEKHDTYNPNSHGLSIYLPYRYYEDYYEYLAFSIDSTWDEFIVWYLYGGQDSNPPDKPSISGESEGLYGNTYSYQFFSEDPDGDDIYYIIDWGDQSGEHEYGPKKTGEMLNVEYSWDSDGFFTIKARAVDTNSAYSDWEYFTVQMPRSKIQDRLGSLYLFNFIFEKFFKEFS
jgi:hypothetical protein